MSLKQEIEIWVAALAAYDTNEFDNALRCFEQIADTSKILFNLGVINATLGEHARAVDFYQRAVQLDQYLAIAYFQQGVSNFLIGDFEEALANFNDTLLYLRGNNNIDYEQLGLKFKLYSCEVLFNRGLCYIYLQQKEAGMQDLHFSSREKRAAVHEVIDEAIREQAEGYTVFSIPVGVVYRPNEAKVKNLKTKDYLGKARLVAAQQDRRSSRLPAMAVDDRPEEKLSYAALNLVKPDLRSRSTRQQSEPPMQRNVFPPTPPPEPERPESLHAVSRRKSNESGRSSSASLQHSRAAARPLRLELGAAAFEQRSHGERLLRPRRSESERPALRQEHPTTSTRNRESRRRDEGLGNRETRVREDPIRAVVPQRSTTQPPRNQPVTISEEAESHDEPLAFEIVQPGSTTRAPRAPPPELRKIRIKVHAEDMRYVMTPPDVRYDELAAQIQRKFGLQCCFKLKIKDDEGDLITLGDQDDLEMAMSICKSAAARERAEMGKMEMWVHEI